MRILRSWQGGSVNRQVSKCSEWKGFYPPSYVCFLWRGSDYLSCLAQTQIQYLKQVQQPSVAQLRSPMVDPAINLFFLKMKGELEQTKDKLEQAQNELSAWKFTPDR